MPKMKTKRAAAKRFKPRASGSIKRAHATKRHILSHRTTKNKRHLRGMSRCMSRTSSPSSACSPTPNSEERS